MLEETCSQSWGRSEIVGENDMTLVFEFFMTTTMQILSGRDDDLQEAKKSFRPDATRYHGTGVVAVK